MGVRVLLQGEAEKPMAKLHMEKKKEMLLQRRTSLRATVLEQKQFLELLSFELQDIESKIKEINEDRLRSLTHHQCLAILRRRRA